ncbi:hypothetical protein DMUE_2842 [Dictyocoela muelleri]|nr:hypothetical protein DMUE_2842 [Dictyocoela muelleri]
MIYKMDIYIKNNGNIKEIKILWENFKQTIAVTVHLMILITILENFFYTFLVRCSRIMNDVPKTINYLEGWHRSLNNNFIHSHPSIYEFGEELKKQHASVEHKINMLFLYDNKYDVNAELKQKIIKYDDFIGIQHLKTIASLLKIKNKI